MSTNGETKKKKSQEKAHSDERYKIKMTSAMTRTGLKKRKEKKDGTNPPHNTIMHAEDKK